MEEASKVRIVPQKGRGKGEIIPLDKKIVSYWISASRARISRPDSRIQHSRLLLHLSKRYLRLLA